MYGIQVKLSHFHIDFIIFSMSAQSEYSMNQTIMNDSISKPIDEQKLNHILSKYVA